MKIGFWAVLALLFITLKLQGVIAWSWFWVLAPLWLPVIALFLIWLPILLGMLAWSLEQKDD